MLRSLYGNIIKISGRPYAIWALAGISFLESSIFPIPPDVLLIPMILAAPTRWFKIAFICTISSVLGGLAGYAIGFLAFERIGMPLLQLYAYENQFSEFRGKYAEYGQWIVFFGGTTMFPFKLVTIASGVFELDLANFTVTSIVARGIRFFSVALFLWWLGPPIRSFIERRLGLITILFFALLVCGFMLVKYAF